MIRERELRRFDREQMARDRKLLEDAIAEVQRLRAVNAKLLAALEEIDTELAPTTLGTNELSMMFRRAREAIEEAKK